MIKPGYIRLIDGKVKFEYYKMKKPKRENWYKIAFCEKDYNEAMKEYEASKRVIEVSNGKRKVKNQMWILVKNDSNHYTWTKFKDNTPCKAGINEKVTIIELTK